STRRAAREYGGSERCTWPAAANPDRHPGSSRRTTSPNTVTHAHRPAPNALTKVSEVCVVVETWLGRPLPEDARPSPDLRAERLGEDRVRITPPSWWGDPGGADPPGPGHSWPELASGLSLSLALSCSRSRWPSSECRLL